MPTNIYRGTTPAVAQVVTATPANVESGDVFTLTLTLDNGDTVDVEFTATAATVANVTAGLVAAWAASGNPEVQRITAEDDTTHVTLTAVTAGRPFAISASATNGGAADTQTLTLSTVTANSGPNDYGVDGNWTLDRIPDDADDVVIPPGAPPIYYGLRQGSITLGSFRVEDGGPAVGRYEDGHLFCLDINPGLTCYIGGAAQVAIDIGTAAIPVVVNNTGAVGATGVAVHIQGTAITDLTNKAGQTGVGLYADHAATITDEIIVDAGRVVIGRNATVTGTNAFVAPGAALEAYKTMPAVRVEPGGTHTQCEGTWTALIAVGTDEQPATVYADAGGTYATTTCYGNVILDASRTMAEKTFTTTTVAGADRRRFEPARTTWTTVNQYAVAR